MTGTATVQDNSKSDCIIITAGNTVTPLFNMEKVFELN